MHAGTWQLRILTRWCQRIIFEDDGDDAPSGGATAEKTVSKTDPDCGMFVKGSHERQFAYEAHSACDRRGFVLGVEVTAGNISDSVAWDAVYAYERLGQSDKLGEA